MHAVKTHIRIFLTPAYAKQFIFRKGDKHLSLLIHVILVFKGPHNLFINENLRIENLKPKMMLYLSYVGKRK